MNRTKIEWVINPDGSRGFTSNPVTGCWGPGGSEKRPARCPWCYAWRIARGTARIAKQVRKSWTGLAQPPFNDDPFRPTFYPHELGHIRARRKPATIFIGSMADAWGEWVPTLWINAILEVVQDRPQHTFIFLTKNPARYLAFSPFPANVVLGATAIDQKMATRALFHLSQAEAPVKFLSCEPLLGQIALPKHPPIDWLIVGALSLGDRKTRQPHPSWVDLLVNGADRSKIPVFMKDNLDWPLFEKFPKRRDFPPFMQEKEAEEQLVLF